MDYSNKAYTQPYMGLYHELEGSNYSQLTMNQVPYDWFDSGYALYVFNCDKDHGHSKDNGVKVGDIEMSGRFAKEPVKNLLFIVMLSYENYYKIDSNRNVVFEDVKKSSKAQK